MNEFEILIVHSLNTLQRIGVVYELAWFMSDHTPTVLFALFVASLIAARGDYARMRQSVLLGGWAGFLALMIVIMIDYFGMIERARPDSANPDMILGVQMTSDSSFPSSLTVITWAVATALWRAPQRTTRWASVAIAFWTGISRVILAENWPSDIIGSALLGYLSAQMALRVILTPGPVEIINRLARSLTGKGVRE